jgi:predicted PurR-regulated permease PerM
LLIPILFSGFVALLLSPLVKLLKHYYVPRSISSFVLLGLLVAPFLWLSAELVEPAQRWAKLLPKASVELNQKLDTLSKEFAIQQKQAQTQAIEAKKEEEGFSFFGLFSSPEPEPVVNEEDNVNTVEKRLKQGSIELVIDILRNAPFILAQFLASLILTLFLLIYGPSVFEAIKSFPQITNKKELESIVNQVQKVLSKYIVTISAINFLLGALTAAIFTLLDIQDAILWGVLVGLFNFVPYVGSVLSVSILLLAGVVQFGFSSLAFMPAGLFLIINMLESQVLTPMVLGTKMQLNPLVIILWLLVLGWMWGILGVLLAVPILVCIKLTLERLNVLTHWLSFIEAKS